MGKVERCAGREGFWGGDIRTELAGVKEDVLVSRNRQKLRAGHRLACLSDRKQVLRLAPGEDVMGGGAHEWAGLMRRTGT